MAVERPHQPAAKSANFLWQGGFAGSGSIHLSIRPLSPVPVGTVSPWSDDARRAVMAVRSKLSGVAYGIATKGTNGENMPPAGASEPGAYRRLESAAVTSLLSQARLAFPSLRADARERVSCAQSSDDTCARQVSKDCAHPPGQDEPTVHGYLPSQVSAEWGAKLVQPHPERSRRMRRAHREVPGARPLILRLRSG